MLLKTFNADGTPQRIEVQTNVQSLLFTIKSKITRTQLNEALEDGATTEEAFCLDRIMASLPGLVSITRYSSDGQKNVVTNVPMSALMEISAFGRAVVYHKRVVDSPAIAGGYINYYSTFFVPLSNFGAVKADKADFVAFEYTNPLNSIIQTYSVNSIGSYVSGLNYMQIDTLSAQENQTTNFDCELNYLLVLPKDADRIRLDSKAGDSLELKGSEIADLQHMTTDHIHDVDGRMYKSYHWNAIDVAQAYRGELLFATKSNFYLLSNRLVTDYSSSAQAFTSNKRSAFTTQM